MLNLKNKKNNNMVEFLRTKGEDNLIKNNNYEINKELSNDGWFSDDTGVYVPYTYKNDKWYDSRNVLNLNSINGAHISFVESFEDKINKFDRLSTLKDENCDFSKQILTNFTVSPTIVHYNFIDIRELFRLIIKQNPIRTYPKKGFYIFNYPFHESTNANAPAFRGYTNGWQLNQPGFMIYGYGLNNPQKVEIKYEWLMSL